MLPKFNTGDVVRSNNLQSGFTWQISKIIPSGCGYLYEVFCHTNRLVCMVVTEDSIVKVGNTK